LRFPTAADSTYDFTLQPLYAQVDIPQSTYSVTPNKIEISLHKAKSGLKWSSLEGTEIIADATASTEPALPTQNIVSPVPVTKAPLYPTSSRNGPKDWDAVAKEALHAENKKASDKKVEEDSIDGEDDDDEMGGDPANAFFAKLYKNADPDTKRAMMKSFQESNGTTLSTDWKDVGSRTIETNPPEGVQAKKWGA
jgi:suppressor of G2 allele of SKP1